MATKRIVLTGASGLIGSSIRRSFQGKQIEILQFVRRGSALKEGQLVWDPYADGPIIDFSCLASLEGAAAVIHLSGAGVADRRWTESYKRTIFQSRIQTTHALATLLAGLQAKPALFICASAIGIYGNRGGEPLTEASTPGSGFLPEVCTAWEQAAEPAAQAGIRVVHMRFGVVLSPEGGALAQMLPAFRLGLGAKLGDGRQWMSWIALSDVVRAIEFALASEGLSGALNVVAPVPVRNLEFTRVLGEALGRPAILAAPAFVLRLALGQMADGAILAGQRVFPERLQVAGFRFLHPDLSGALSSLLSSNSQAGA